MRELLIGAAVLGVAVLSYVLARPRKTLAGEMDAPINVEKHRARSEAEMAAPVSDADEEAAAPLVAYVEEIGSGEFPSLAFDADPLGERIPDGYVMEEEAFFHHLAADRLSAFTWAAASRTTVALSSVQVVEPGPPEPFALEGPTGVFPKDWLDRAMAEAKAASR